MKSVGIVIQSIISIAILGGGVYGYLAMGEPEVPKRPPRRGGDPVVQTVKVEPYSDSLRVEVDGLVIPYRQIRIAAEVQGRVAKKMENCRKGRKVHKGELLLEIDDRDYEFDVKRLMEELKQAEAMIDELEVEIQTSKNQYELTSQQLEIDQRQLERNLQLSSSAAVSQSELDTARRAELSTRNALREIADSQSLLKQRLVRMESGKQLVQVNLEKAQLALQRTKVQAPLDGMIVDESVEQDGFVQAGSPVAVIQDNSQFDVACKLHMRQMHWLWQTQADEKNGGSQTSSVGVNESLQLLSSGYDFPAAEAVVSFELDGNEYQWKGVLDRYDGGGIDEQTRMVPCRLRIDEPLDVTLVSSRSGSGPIDEVSRQPPTLMAGMFVKVTVFVKPPRRLLQIPQKAIQPGEIVWIVRDGGLVSHKLQRATAETDFVVAYEVEKSLAAGDSIVISPLATPFVGQKVTEVAQ